MGVENALFLIQKVRFFGAETGLLCWLVEKELVLHTAKLNTCPFIQSTGKPGKLHTKHIHTFGIQGMVKSVTDSSNFGRH
jgi:hypothetical protein